jgi:hypothetical protein
LYAVGTGTIEQPVGIHADTLPSGLLPPESCPTSLYDHDNRGRPSLCRSLLLYSTAHKSLQRSEIARLPCCDDYLTVDELGCVCVCVVVGVCGVGVYLQRRINWCAGSSSNCPPTQSYSVGYIVIVCPYYGRLGREVGEPKGAYLFLLNFMPDRERYHGGYLGRLVVGGGGWWSIKHHVYHFLRILCRIGRGTLGSGWMERETAQLVRLSATMRADLDSDVLVVLWPGRAAGTGHSFEWHSSTNE